MKTTILFRLAVISTAISSAAHSAPIPYRRSLETAIDVSYPSVILEARSPSELQEHSDHLEELAPEIDVSKANVQGMMLLVNGQHILLEIQKVSFLQSKMLPKSR